MIIIDTNTDYIVMSKVNRCALDCSSVYQLILQHTSSRDLIIYKVRDYSPDHPIYFSFSFTPPEDMQYGEYKVYLVRDADWYVDEIDLVSIEDSERESTDKKPVTINGYYILTGDTLMMTKNQKKILADAYGSVATDGGGIIVNSEAHDKRVKGELYTESIEIIYTDILRFMQPVSLGCEPVKTRNRPHVEYKRHER